MKKIKSTYKPEDNDSELLWKFQTEPNEQIILKIGLSSVSAEEAEANLKKRVLESVFRTDTHQCTYCLGKSIGTNTSRNF